jgi:hypothetical protein
MRFTLGLSLLIGIAANVLLLIAGGYVLGVFGHTYSGGALTTLHILVLGVFPLTIKGHYTAICRIHRSVPRAALWMLLGAAFEVAMAAAGAVYGGLTGLCLGWLAATCLEAVCVSPVVYRVAVQTDPCLVG